MNIEKSTFAGNIELLQEFKIKVKQAVNEFLNLSKNDFEYFASQIKKIEFPQFSSEITKILISTSLDYKDKERILAFDSICYLIKENIISTQDLRQGLNILVGRLHDLVLDVPLASTYLHQYISKAVEKNFITSQQAKGYFSILATSVDKKIITDIRRRSYNLFRQYFASHSFDEFVEGIHSFDSVFYPNIIKYGISLSFDLTNHEREMVSRILARVTEDSLNSNFFSKNELVSAFIMLLDQLDDLHTDVPDVDRLLSYFIARAIADESLSINFLDRFDENEIAYPIIKQVRVLIGQKGSVEKLEKVQGPDTHYISEIKKAFRLIILEFFNSRDSQEVHSAILEVNVPHYHHEFVKQLISASFDHDYKIIESSAKLLKNLVFEGVISINQIDKGFERIQNAFDDILIDVPNAKEMFDKILEIYNSP